MVSIPYVCLVFGPIGNKRGLTLCSFLNFHTALSAAVLLAAYKIPGAVFLPSALSLVAVSRATVAKSSSVKT